MTKRIILVTLLLSISLSSLLICFDTQPLNVDGILYIEVAKIYQSSGLSNAMALYPWPFFSLLIAWISQLSQFSLLHSALILNTVFTTFTVIFYLLILEELGASRKIILCGALLILIYPELNVLRLFIIRDAGYWAFFLAAFWQLLRYTKKPNWPNALGWGTLLFIATLFRIEGAILLIFAPLLLLLQTNYIWRLRLTQVLQNYAVLFLAGAVLILWHFAHHSSQPLQYGRLTELSKELISAWQMITNNFNNNQAIIANAILVNTNGDNADVFLSAGLIGVFMNDLLNTLSILNIFLVGYAIYNHLLPRRQPQYLILIGFTLLNLLIPLVFYLQNFIITSRYLIPACLLLLLWAPFALYAMWVKARASSYWLLSIITLALSITAISGIVRFGYSKAYIINAGQWIEKNVATNAIIYSNSREVLFYAGRSTYNWPINNNINSIIAPLKNSGWKNFDYLAIRVNNNNDNLIKQIVTQLPLQPKQVFTNKRDDRVIIFYVPH